MTRGLWAAAFRAMLARVRDDLGRFFDGRNFETQKLMKVVYDLALGLGKDVSTFLEGRELGFTRGTAKFPGFLRMLPEETSVTLYFPQGPRLLDPKKKLRGYPSSTARLVLYSTLDLDPYTRRLVDQAYAIAPTE